VRSDLQPSGLGAHFVPIGTKCRYGCSGRYVVLQFFIQDYPELLRVFPSTQSFFIKYRLYNLTISK